MFLGKCLFFSIIYLYYFGDERRGEKEGKNEPSHISKRSGSPVYTAGTINRKIVSSICANRNPDNIYCWSKTFYVFEQLISFRCACI